MFTTSTSLLMAESLLILLCCSFCNVLGGSKPPPPSIYGEFAPEKPLEQDPDQQAIVSTLIALLFLLMAFEVGSPEVLFLIALTIVTFCEIITLPEALSGFSNAAVITIGSLFIVIGAIEKSHVVDWFARKAFGSSGSVTIGKLRLYVMCFSLSTFFNNTPLVALLMPVVRDWGRMRGISASQLLMPLSYAVLAGSFGSMIGTSTNLTIQGLMLADRGYTFSFFAPLPIGIVCFLCLLVYMLIAGPYILPSDQSGLIRQARDKTESLIAEIFVSSSSQAVGKSVSHMMSSIGLPPSYAIKIRRREGVAKKSVDIHHNNNDNNNNNNDASSKDAESRNITASTDILDNKYINRVQEFWRSAGSTNSNGNLSPSNTSYTAIQSNNSSSSSNNTAVDLEGLGLGLGLGLEQTDHPAYIDIVVPSGHELIQADDVVFVSSAQEVVAKMMKAIAGESKGLHILDADVMALPGFGSEIVECVISDSNPYIGQKLSVFASSFANKYKVGVITVRAKDWGQEKQTDNSIPVAQNDESTKPEGGARQSVGVGVELTEVNATATATATATADAGSTHPEKDLKSAANTKVGEHQLSCGDIVLGVTNSKEISSLSQSRDFFVVSTVGSLPMPITFHSFMPIILFILMLIMVALEYVDICPASMLFASLIFIGGWIKADEIPKLVDLRLLMLLGASLSFSTSMTKSGLAARIAEDIISKSDVSPYSATLVIYIITLIITELISNNAAAALMYPIAVGLADGMKLSFKPFAMTVLVASTAGFMSPIGYQTHMMVWGPGGYKFKDFIVFGIIPDLIYLFVGCAMIHLIYF